MILTCECGRKHTIEIVVKEKRAAVTEAGPKRRAARNGASLIQRVLTFLAAAADGPQSLADIAYALAMKKDQLDWDGVGAALDELRIRGAIHQDKDCLWAVGKSLAFRPEEH